MEKQMITKVNFGKRISDLRIGGRLSENSDNLI